MTWSRSQRRTRDDTSVVVTRLRKVLYTSLPEIRRNIKLTGYAFTRWHQLGFIDPISQW